jgi:hypothetical protein
VQGTCDRSVYKRGRGRSPRCPPRNSALALQVCFVGTAGSEMRPCLQSLTTGPRRRPPTQSRPHVSVFAAERLPFTTGSCRAAVPSQPSVAHITPFHGADGADALQLQGVGQQWRPILVGRRIGRRLSTLHNSALNLVSLRRHGRQILSNIPQSPRGAVDTLP